MNKKTKSIQSKSKSKKVSISRPGSSAKAAKAIGGKGDFGVPESNVAERNYTSKNTKRSDRGNAPIHAGTDGSRVSGVGGNASGAGSSSGGDLDTDIVGLDGGGIAASGKIHEPPGPDDAVAYSSPLTNKGQHVSHVRGSTVQPADDRTVGPVGADAASNPDSNDDSFAGDVSSGEATGRDEAGDGRAEFFLV